MPASSRLRQQPTDDWDQLRLLVASPALEAYELLRPLVLFGQMASARARETGVPERTLRRNAAYFAAAGMSSLFEPDDPPAPDRRALPLGIRKAIVELKAEYPSLGHEALTIEYASETLAQYRITLEADGHRLREVGEPRLYATAHAPPQPFLPPLDLVDWHPATRLAPYRGRWKRGGDEHQKQLVEVENKATREMCTPPRLA